jgi:hypothetical protein
MLSAITPYANCLSGSRASGEVDFRTPVPHDR